MGNQAKDRLIARPLISPREIEEATALLHRLSELRSLTGRLNHDLNTVGAEINIGQLVHDGDVRRPRGSFMAIDPREAQEIITLFRDRALGRLIELGVDVRPVKD